MIGLYNWLRKRELWSWERGTRSKGIKNHGWHRDDVVSAVCWANLSAAYNKNTNTDRVYDSECSRWSLKAADWYFGSLELYKKRIWKSRGKAKLLSRQSTCVLKRSREDRKDSNREGGSGKNEDPVFTGPWWESHSTADIKDWFTYSK